MRIVFLLLLFSFSIKAQKKANFKSAEKFSQKNLSKMLKSTSVSPEWFKESDKFWYSYTTTSGKNFYIVEMHDVFKKNYTRNKKKFEFEVDYHWNEMGHKLVADELLKLNIFK